MQTVLCGTGGADIAATPRMYPADDTDVRLRLLVHQLTAMRERLRQEVERSRALRAWIHATRLARAHRPPRPPL